MSAIRRSGAPFLPPVLFSLTDSKLSKWLYEGNQLAERGSIKMNTEFAIRERIAVARLGTGVQELVEDSARRD